MSAEPDDAVLSRPLLLDTEPAIDGVDEVLAQLQREEPLSMEQCLTLEQNLNVVTYSITRRTIDLRERIHALELRLGLRDESSEGEDLAVRARDRRLSQQSNRSGAGSGVKRKGAHTPTDRPTKMQRVPSRFSVPAIKPQFHPFWQGMTPYFADITQKDVDDACKLANDEKVLEIPPLGKHYTRTWATEDDRARKHVSGGSHGSTPPRDSESQSGPPASIWNRGVHPTFAAFPPLLRRLLDSFSDNNIVKMSWRREDLLTTQEADDFSSTPKPGQEAPLKTRLMSNLSTVFGQSLSTPPSRRRHDAQDEVLEELKQAHVLLKAHARVNKEHKERLRTRAKAAMAEQKKRAKLSAADASVREAYNDVKKDVEGSAFIARKALQVRKDALKAWKESVLSLEQARDGT